jgi:hypothetical protein
VLCGDIARPWADRPWVGPTDVVVVFRLVGVVSYDGHIVIVRAGCAPVQVAHELRIAGLSGALPPAIPGSEAIRTGRQVA